MFSRSDSAITIGRLVGAPVRVGPGAVIIAGLLAYQLAGQWSDTSSVAVAWIAAAATATTFLISILAHELGHAIAARRAGINVSEIRLWLLGGAAALERPAPDGKSEMRIAAAGPAVSVLFGLASIGAAYGLDATSGPELLIDALAWLGVVNLVLAVLNMLPGLPLDGGRVLIGWLWLRRSDRLSAVRTGASVGRVLGYLAFAFAALEFFVLRTGTGIFTAFIGLVLTRGAAAELAHAEVAARLGTATVADVTRFDPPTISDAANTASARALLPSSGQSRLAVMTDEDGVARGLIDIVQVDRAADRDGTDPVAALALPLDERRAAFVGEPLANAMARGVNLPFVVIDERWQPVGLVTSWFPAVPGPPAGGSSPGEPEAYSHAP